MRNQLKNLTEQLQKAQNKTFTNKTLNNKKRNRFLRKISSYENTDTDIESGYKDEYEQEQMEDNSNIPHYINVIQKIYPYTIKEMNSYQKKTLIVRFRIEILYIIYYLLFIIYYLLLFIFCRENYS